LADDKDIIGRLVAEEFGPEVQRDFLRHLDAVYRTSAAEAASHDRAQHRKVYGNLRLANLETSLKLFCPKHSGITAGDVPFKKGGYPHFTMTTKSLVITCHGVARPDLLPRKAIFRQSLATGANYVLPLFPTQVEGTEGREFYHVMALHSFERRVYFDEATRTVKEVRRYDRPAFCELVVPTPDTREEVWRLSLFGEHADVIDRLRGLSREDVAGNGPKRRRQRDEKGEKGA